jgi:hypothetical protein
MRGCGQNIGLVLSICIAVGLTACERLSSFSLKTPSSFPLNPYGMDMAINGTISGHIIRKNDIIRPYFLKPATQDSDISGFQISLKTAEGVQRNETLEYTVSRSNFLEMKITDSVKRENPMSGGANRALYYLQSDPRPVFISDLDNIPPYNLPPDLAIGRYIMLFHILRKTKNSETSILSTTEKPFFYLDDAQFIVDDLRMYAPNPTDSPFAPAETAILIEAPLSADERLDPYIMWFDGKKKLNTGKTAHGAGRLLWKTPSIEGFKNIRAEIFPFPPFQKTAGVLKEISIPITAKEKSNGYFAGQAKRFSHWYWFRGNLQDEQERNQLIRRQYQLDQWFPTGDRYYGLGLGINSYLIPSAHFTASKTEKKFGQLLFRISLVSDGIIAKITFESMDGSSIGVLSLVSEEKSPLLLLETGNSETIIKKLSVENIRSEITLCLNFELERNRLAADISLEDSPNINAPFFTLSNPFGGNAVFQLGAESENTVAVLNELGVTFNRSLTDRASP